VILAISGASVNRMYNGLDTRADAILSGCALGMAPTSGLIDGLLLEAKIAPIFRYVEAAIAVLLLAIAIALSQVKWSSPDMLYYIFVVV
jgi:hypothetical protein